MASGNYTILGLVILSVGCTTVQDRGADSSSIQGVLLDDVVVRAARWDHALSPSGNTITGLYDKNNQLVAKFPGEATTVQLGKQEGAGFASGIAVANSDTRYGAVWYEKATQKAVQLVVDGAIQPVNIDAEIRSNPLPVLGMSFLPDDRWQVLWVGERDTGGRSRYNTYARVEGASAQVVLPADGLVWGQEPDGTTVVFGRQPFEQGGEFMFSVRPGLAAAFEAPQRILATGNYGPVFRGWAADGVWAVAWDENVEKVGVANQISLAYSLNRGLTWERTIFEGDPSTVWYDIDLVSDGAGKIVVVLVGNRKDAETGMRTSLIRLHHKTADSNTWSEAYFPRSDRWSFAKAANPKLVVKRDGDDAELYVLWEDWRNFRPQIFGGYSEDFGATWKAIDQRLKGQNDERLGLQVIKSLDHHMDGTSYVVANRYVDDTFKSSQLYRMPLLPKFDSAEEGAEAAKATKYQERLDRKVGEYWAAVSKRDWMSAYNYLDPFFRAAQSQEAYIKRRGPVNYSNPSLLGKEIGDKFTVAEVQVDVAVPAGSLPGTMVNPPEPRTILVKQKWLWIDGDWYLEYFEESTGLRFANYMNQ